MGGGRGDEMAEDSLKKKVYHFAFLPAVSEYSTFSIAFGIVSLFPSHIALLGLSVQYFKGVMREDILALFFSIYFIDLGGPSKI